MGMVEIKHFRGRQQHLVEMSGPMAELKLMVADTQVVYSFEYNFFVVEIQLQCKNNVACLDERAKTSKKFHFFLMTSSMRDALLRALKLKWPTLLRREEKSGPAYLSLTSYAPAEISTQCMIGEKGNDLWSPVSSKNKNRTQIDNMSRSITTSKRFLGLDS